MHVTIEGLLESATAAFALLAAIVWFRSAALPIPPMVSYYGSIPSNDPYQLALRHVAQLNRFAAAFSGLSALCAFLAVIVAYFLGHKT